MATRTGQPAPAQLTGARHALRRLEGVEDGEAAASRARLMVPVAAVKFPEPSRREHRVVPARRSSEAKRGDAKDALAEAYKVLDLAYLENGEIEKATHSGEALAIYEEFGDLRNQALVLNNHRPHRP